MAYGAWNPPFEVGARVKVVGQRKYRSEKLVGLIGTVKTNYSNSIAVLLDTTTNDRSSYGYFYFKPNELIEADESDNEIMEEKTMNNAITNYLNIARVKYINDGRYGINQYANFDPCLEEGDHCVVVTEVGQFLVAQVVEIVDERDTEMYREVVTKIDATAYEARLDARAQAADLKAKMEARAKKLQDIALYQMLAKDDTEMAALLSAYQDLPLV